MDDSPVKAKEIASRIDVFPLPLGPIIKFIPGRKVKL
jgi:hypothetical protein